MNTGMDSALSSSVMQSGGSQIWIVLPMKIISNLTKKDENDLKRLFNRDVEQLYKDVLIGFIINLYHRVWYIKTISIRPFLKLICHVDVTIFKK